MKINCNAEVVIDTKDRSVTLMRIKDASRLGVIGIFVMKCLQDRRRKVVTHDALETIMEKNNPDNWDFSAEDVEENGGDDLIKDPSSAIRVTIDGETRYYED